MRNTKAVNTNRIGLWAQGQCRDVDVDSLSASHIEMVLREGLTLSEGELVALLVRDFLSLPVRIEMQTGRHLLLQFEQRPHSSILDALREDLFEIAIAKAESAEAQGCLFPVTLGDLEVWDAETAEIDPESFEAAA